MVQNIDELALSCNILLEKLIYLYNISSITREQLLENSKLKVKFLSENINKIESVSIKSDSMKNLTAITDYLTLEERKGWSYNTLI